MSEPTCPEWDLRAVAQRILDGDTVGYEGSRAIVVPPALAEDLAAALLPPAPAVTTEECLEVLRLIRREHGDTMLEFSETGYSEGLCLKPSLFEAVDALLQRAGRGGGE